MQAFGCIIWDKKINSQLLKIAIFQQETKLKTAQMTNSVNT